MRPLLKREAGIAKAVSVSRSRCLASAPIRSSRLAQGQASMPVVVAQELPRPLALMMREITNEITNTTIPTITAPRTALPMEAPVATAMMK